MHAVLCKVPKSTRYLLGMEVIGLELNRLENLDTFHDIVMEGCPPRAFVEEIRNGNLLKPVLQQTTFATVSVSRSYCPSADLACL